jgi:Arm DNA-binding domain
MGRKRKVRRQACSVEITSTGLFRFRFRWKMPDGVVRKFAEATALRDTPENRARVMRQAEMIGTEIRGDAFDY